jgi:hypothetical protein
VVEFHTPGIEINPIRNVMPYTRLERNIPLALRVDVPAEDVARSARCAGEESVLHLGEVGLEEHDLVLGGARWRIGG